MYKTLRALSQRQEENLGGRSKGVGGVIPLYTLPFASFDFSIR